VVFGIAALGCAVATLNAAGAEVEVVTSAEDCRFLGTLKGYEGFNARMPETNVEAVEADLRNRAAALGGNTLVITDREIGSGSPGANGTGGCPNCITMTASVCACKPGAAK
jgi:hypothetical protein